MNRTFDVGGATTIEPDTTLFYPEQFVGRFFAVGALAGDTDFDIAIIDLPEIAPLEANRYDTFRGDRDIEDENENPYPAADLPIGVLVGYGRTGSRLSVAPHP